jgi:uncharacterized membrane protein
MNMDAKKTITIDKSPEELYRFWRNFENLPRFMNHIKSVTKIDDKRSHWIVAAPIGDTVEWDAEIVQDKENETIVWKSLEGADVENTGSVSFAKAETKGTEVKVTIAYKPPGGALGAAFATFFGENPQQQLEDDLNRFKRLMETGTPEVTGSPAT